MSQLTTTRTTTTANQIPDFDDSLPPPSPPPQLWTLMDGSQVRVTLFWYKPVNQVIMLTNVFLACEQALLGEWNESRENARSRVLARLASLAQIGELARRLIFFKNNFHNKAKKVCIKTRSPSPSLPSIADMFSRTWCTCMTPWFYFYISEFYDRSLVIATQIFLDRERKRPARIYSLPTDSNSSSPC